MDDKYQFSKSFVETMDRLNVDTNRALIYAVHIVSSQKLANDKKDDFCLKLAELGHELKNTILAFDLPRITSYTIREKEKAFEAACEPIHKEFLRILDHVDKKYDVIIDRKEYFNIDNVVTTLKIKAGGFGYILPKDKIDNLLSVKELFLQIYEQRIRKAVEADKERDRQYFELQEKTYLQAIRNSAEVNGIYLFRSCQMIKKLISEKTSIRLTAKEAESQANTLEFFGEAATGLGVRYHANGLGFELLLKKIAEGYAIRYEVAGSMEKGLARVEYSLRDSVLFENEAVFERVSGLEAVVQQYEKAFIDNRNAESDLKAKQENLDKSIIDKAIDDFLFK